jgi:signal transduction histidine kinase/ligand-binding sensor domain-containing protein
MYRKSFLFALWLVSAFPLFPQFYEARIAKVIDETGSAPSATFAIVEDDRGFIWFGTIDGLYRYDGYNFKIFRYRKNDPASLSSNTIRALAIDNSQHIWIGTQGGGLSCFDQNTELFTNYIHTGKRPGEISGNDVWAISIDREENIWVGVSGRGIDKLNRSTGSFIHFDLITGFIQSQNELVIRSLYADEEGVIWIGTAGSGLLKLDSETGKVTSFTHSSENPSSLGGNLVFDLIRDRNKRLWVCSYGGGLNLLNDSKGTFKRYNHDENNVHSLVSDLTYGIYEKDTGEFWIATEYGLSVMDASTGDFTHYVHNEANRNSISENRLRTVFIDRNNIVWLGSESGVDKIVYQEKFLLYKNIPGNSNSLPKGIVRAILDDNEGNLYIGLIDNGMVKYNFLSGTYTCYRHDPSNPYSLRSNHVNAIFRDSRGILWVGEWDTGLHQFDPVSERFIPVISSSSKGEHRLRDNRIQVIREAAPGILWLGTENGITRFNSVTRECFHYAHNPGDSNSLSGNSIQSNAFIIEPTGNLWVGTWADGLNHIVFNDSRQQHADFKIWKNIPGNFNSLNNNNVIALHFDTRGILWIGTFGGGLNRFDPRTETFKNYTTENGLPNNVIFSILEDEENNLWLSTDNGLSRFNVAQETFENFYETDGLQSNHFFWGSSYNSSNGKLYFGGINGLNSFLPSDNKTIKRRLSPVLVNLKKFNDPVILKQAHHNLTSIILPYHENFLTFEFTALDFIDPNRNQYKYYLEGFDKNWHVSGNRRFATYTNLSPGKYVFRLKASGSGNLWSPDELEIKVRIRPPWWRTWWAQTIFILLLLGSVLAFYFIRIGLLQKQKKKLTEQVKIRTAEIEHKNVQLEKQQQEITSQNLRLNKQKDELFEKNKQLQKTLSELEIAQKALIESEKMASLGILSAGVAHEINNPLNFIALSIENIKHRLSELNTVSDCINEDELNKLKELLAYSESGVERISTIVSSLRSYVYSGDQQFQPADIKDIINAAITIIHSKIPSHIIMEYSPLDLPEVNCRPNQLTQVIINIIDNAIDSINEKTERARDKIAISTYSQTSGGIDYVVIEIANTGPPIPEKVMKHLFDPFFTTKSPNKGTGLGLYISYNIVKDHQGRLEAVNQADQVVFSIFVPIKGAISN